MITIVSGLPRSGTSLVMQMLKAGGMEVLTDGVRKPDENNPLGYFEYEKVKLLMKEDGIAFIQTIGGNFSSTTTNAWTAKYIFPNSMLPSVAYLGNAMEKLFVVEDWHNFGPDYDKTLMAWYSNFEESWPQLKEKYGDKFYRIWKFYLLSSAVGFRSRRNHLWQIVMTKQGREQPNCRIS